MLWQCLRLASHPHSRYYIAPKARWQAAAASSASFQGSLSPNFCKPSERPSTARKRERRCHLLSGRLINSVKYTSKSRVLASLAVTVSFSQKDSQQFCVGQPLQTVCMMHQTSSFNLTCSVDKAPHGVKGGSIAAEPRSHREDVARRG